MSAQPNLTVVAGGAPEVLTPDWALWPVSQAMRLRVVLLRDAHDALHALTPTPDDDLLRDAVSVAVSVQVGQPLRWRAGSEDELQYWLGLGQRDYDAMEGLAGGDGGAEGDADGAPQVLSIQSLSEQTSPVVRLLDATLFDALKAEASDLHMECHPGGMTLRYRLDGVMEAVGEVGSREMAEQLVSRLKVMAELDIGERRLPQDGRFKLHVQAGESVRDVDFRVSIMPSSYGEDAVIRVLDRTRLAADHTALTLERLGFGADDSEAIHRLANKPYGMLLVTGPTGSGKTTTLYAVIAQINDGRDKIITIEDPVEYQLPGVVQIPVNEKKGLTFARGLRSILRHDPDKVMVGEIRDAETAQIASQAALTGHLVLTTVHANNSFDVIGRFMHMGLDLYNVVSALNGVLAQRLMRRLCTHCAQPWQPTPADLRAAGLGLDRTGRFMKAIGCPHCRGTGYKGRRAIAEILVMDDTLRDLIVSRQSLTQIKAHARAAGTRLLRESAIACVLAGETTLEELNRVTLAE
jgi:general secretion pathway protein E